MKHSQFIPKESLTQIKDKDKKLTAHEQRMYTLLLNGGQYSNKELIGLLPDRDPRSTIRYLRNKGITIGDVWVKNKYSRHKLYFIHR